MNATAKGYLYALLALVLVIGGVCGYKAIRAAGANGVLMGQAAVTHTTDVKVQKTDSAVAVASIKVATDSALRTKALIATATGRLAAERKARLAIQASLDSARGVLNDSLATIDSLRAELGDVLSLSQQLMETDSAQFVADSAAILSAQHTILAQQKAITDGTVAYNAALARAISAENESALLRKAMPSKFAAILVNIGVAGAAYTIAHLSK